MGDGALSPPQADAGVSDPEAAFRACLTSLISAAAKKRGCSESKLLQHHRRTYQAWLAGGGLTKSALTALLRDLGSSIALGDQLELMRLHADYEVIRKASDGRGRRNGMARVSRPGADKARFGRITEELRLAPAELRDPGLYPTLTKPLFVEPRQDGRPHDAFIAGNAFLSVLEKEPDYLGAMPEQVRASILVFIAQWLGWTGYITRDRQAVVRAREAIWRVDEQLADQRIWLLRAHSDMWLSTLSGQGRAPEYVVQLRNAMSREGRVLPLQGRELALCRLIEIEADQNITPFTLDTRLERHGGRTIAHLLEENFTILEQEAGAENIVMLCNAFARRFTNSGAFDDAHQIISLGFSVLEREQKPCEHLRRILRKRRRLVEGFSQMPFLLWSRGALET